MGLYQNAVSEQWSKYKEKFKEKQGRYIKANNPKACLSFSSLLQWLIQVAKQTQQKLQHNFNSWYNGTSIEVHMRSLKEDNRIPYFSVIYHIKQKQYI